MLKTSLRNTGKGAWKAGLTGLLMVTSVTAFAQRGAISPAAHAGQEPINNLPNPYETQRDFGTLPDGRGWGSVSAVNVDIDGVHVWAGDRCGTNSCATSDVDPIVKLDPSGRVVASLGAGQIIWPHGMDVDAEGNIWVADARLANERELQANPAARNHGSSVLKFSPEGELLMVIGTPGEMGDPPTHLTEPNDVLVAPNGRIYIGETHGAQFQDEPGPNSKSRITIWEADGTYVGSFGEWGQEDGQFRAPHSLAMDSQEDCLSLTAGIIAFRFLPRTASTSIPGTSSAVIAVSGLTRVMTGSTPSIPSRIRTTTPAVGAKVCALAAPKPERSGTSCPSMSLLNAHQVWVASDPWAKG